MASSAADEDRGGRFWRGALLEGAWNSGVPWTGSASNSTSSGICSRLPAWCRRTLSDLASGLSIHFLPRHLGHRSIRPPVWILKPDSVLPWPPHVSHRTQSPDERFKLTAMSAGPQMEMNWDQCLIGLSIHRPQSHRPNTHSDTSNAPSCALDRECHSRISIRGTHSGARMRPADTNSDRN